MSSSLGLLGVPLAVFAGAIRGGTPFLFVSTGECLTEKSGKINLGLEGVLLMGAMTAYAISYKTGSPWIGLLAAGGAGLVLGFIHAWLAQQPKVNDIAAGIAMIIFGSGMAFFLGKPFIQPLAPQLPGFEFGWWSDSPPCNPRSASARSFSSASPSPSPCTGSSMEPAGACSSAPSAISRTPPAHGYFRLGRAHPEHHVRQFFSPASAAPISRSSIREAGPNAFPAARA